VQLINLAIAERPAGMMLAMHLCRGNFRSSWIAQGGYEPVADLLFNTIGIDVYFMIRHQALVGLNLCVSAAP
jgi:5-methyltetrahydropteroyltriglutamate--homocysteine methyltransferase